MFSCCVFSTSWTRAWRKYGWSLWCHWWQTTIFHQTRSHDSSRTCVRRLASMERLLRSATVYTHFAWTIPKNFFLLICIHQCNRMHNCAKTHQTASSYLWWLLATEWTYLSSERTRRWRHCSTAPPELRTNTTSSITFPAAKRMVRQRNVTSQLCNSRKCSTTLSQIQRRFGSSTSR